jgi:hypothetical protein
MKLHQALPILFVGFALTACKQPCETSAGKDTKVSSSGAGSRNVASSTPSSTSTTKVDEQCPVPTDPNPPTPPPPVEPPAPVASYPLLWEAGHPERVAWSTHVMKVITDEVANDFLPGTSDIELFCPRYHSLDNKKRANLWALLISAMTKFESGFDPLSRYKESTMGVDPVTQQHVYSEGLLQLSYQDVQWASYCEFDWEKDKNLAVKDPKKTILNPYKNLSCGIKILARQVRNKDAVAVKSGAYWAVLIPGGKYTKLNEIAALTKKMTGCQ